ncbi:MAG: hypothetical protein HY738_13185 [Bacteroidia bacterium]|nr:hypothetical protein [Bacteroidia bacterium]
MQFLNAEVLLVRTKNGLYRCVNGNLSVVDAFGKDVYNEILKKVNETVMVKTVSGIFIIREHEIIPLKIPEEIPKSSIRYIDSDKKGNMFFITLNGLYIFHPDSSVSHYSTNNGLSSDDIYSMCIDHDGNLWIGTNGGGLNKLKKSLLLHFQKKTD